MHFVDTNNAIAAGGSYGGYMAFWIQGMPLGRKLKAIVAHDGVFSMSALISHLLIFQL
jgi:dipeptidyl aminopeptidase/acylaminoacyl peptidase